MKDANAMDSADLPASAASTAGAAAGSLGECSMADLKRGYAVVPCEADKGYQCDCPECTASRSNEGFLGRPDPYARDQER